MPILHGKMINNFYLAQAPPTSTADKSGQCGSPRASLYAPRNSVMSANALNSRRRRLLRLRKDIVAVEALEEQQFRVSVGQLSPVSTTEGPPSPKRAKKAVQQNDAIMKYWMSTDDSDGGSVVIHL